MILISRGKVSRKLSSGNSFQTLFPDIASKEFFGTMFCLLAVLVCKKVFLFSWEERILYFINSFSLFQHKNLPIGEKKSKKCKNIIKLPYSAKKLLRRASSLSDFCFDFQSCVNVRLYVYDSTSYSYKANRPKVKTKQKLFGICRSFIR